MDARKFGRISSAQLYVVGICSALLYPVGFPRPHPFQVCSGVRSAQLYAGGKRPSRIGISTPVLCPQGGGNVGQFPDLSGWQDSALWMPADYMRISSAQFYAVVDVANACSENGTRLTQRLLSCCATAHTSTSRGEQPASQALGILQRRTSARIRRRFVLLSPNASAHL